MSQKTVYLWIRPDAPAKSVEGGILPEGREGQVAAVTLTRRPGEKPIVTARRLLALSQQEVPADPFEAAPILDAKQRVVIHG